MDLTRKDNLVTLPSFLFSHLTLFLSPRRLQKSLQLCLLVSKQVCYSTQFCGATISESKAKMQGRRWRTPGRGWERGWWTWSNGKKQTSAKTWPLYLFLPVKTCCSSKPSKGKGGEDRSHLHSPKETWLAWLLDFPMWYFLSYPAKAR